MSEGLYHFHTEPLSRAEGRNAVAAAAYASATALRCDRTGNLFDYGRAHRVAHSEVLAPAAAPAWARDRAQLWNQAEAREKRSDSRVGRLFEGALPNELPPHLQVELVRGFLQAELVERHGVAVDWAIHDEPPKPGKTRNTHWHGTSSHRAISADGFNAKVCSVLNSKDELGRLREAWAVHTNQMLERAGLDLRVDHRSYADRGIDKVPQIHEGAAARRIEENGGISDRCEANREIQRINKRISQLRRRARLVADWWRAAQVRLAQARASKPAAPAPSKPTVTSTLRESVRQQQPPPVPQQPKAAAGPTLPSRGPKSKTAPTPQPSQVPAPRPVLPSPGLSDEDLARWQREQMDRGR